MGSYPEKPIRIDYYPKTKEDTDGLEELEMEDNLVGEVDYRIIGEKGPKRDRATKCSSCVAGDAEIGEEITEDQEETIAEEAEAGKKVMEKTVKNKEEN
ncbi:MAG: hypothetical protein ACOCG5_01930 [Candidatus Alkaliphilus sp. MAG34]